MHKFINRIEKSTLTDRNPSVFKKEGTKICANNWSINLLPKASYKVITIILCKRMKSIVFQIFTMHQILEKTHEIQVDTYTIFVDFKTTFESPIRYCVFIAT